MARSTKPTPGGSPRSGLGDSSVDFVVQHIRLLQNDTNEVVVSNRDLHFLGDERHASSLCRTIAAP